MSHGKRTQYAPKALKVGKPILSKQPHVVNTFTGLTTGDLMNLVTADPRAQGANFFWMYYPESWGDPSAVFPLDRYVATTTRFCKSNVATLTLASDPGLFVGQTITLTGMGDATYNGTHVLTAVSGTSIDFALIHANEPVTADTGGKVYYSAARGILEATGTEVPSVGSNVPVYLEAQVRYGAHDTINQWYTLRVEGNGPEIPGSITYFNPAAYPFTITVENDPYAFSDISWWTCAICGLPERKAKLIRHPRTGQLVHAHDYDEYGVVDLQAENDYRGQAIQHAADLYQTLGEWP